MRGRSVGCPSSPRHHGRKNYNTTIELKTKSEATDSLISLLMFISSLSLFSRLTMVSFICVSAEAASDRSTDCLVITFRIYAADQGWGLSLDLPDVRKISGLSANRGPKSLSANDSLADNKMSAYHEIKIFIRKSWFNTRFINIALVFWNLNLKIKVWFHMFSNMSVMREIFLGICKTIDKIYIWKNAC